MKFSHAIDVFVEDMRAQGRITSDRTVVSYRSILNRHADDVNNNDPRNVNRDMCKRTLRHWRNPNSQRTARAILVSFYDWTMEEGIRKDNPARQTRRPKRQPTTVYRLTKAEAASMLRAAKTTREKRAIYLGICAGLRNRELRGLQGRHFRRPGFIWVSADIAKGGRERHVPVLPDLADIVEQIRETVATDEFVLPAQRWRNPPVNDSRRDLARRSCSSQALRTLVMNVAKRAGIAAHIHPHLLRHAFGDHVARHTGMKVAQAMLGHANVSTTEIYTGQPTLDELAVSVHGLTFEGGSPRETPVLAGKAPTGIEPVLSPSWAIPGLFEWVDAQVRHAVEVYGPVFEGRAA